MMCNKVKNILILLILFSTFKILSLDSSYCKFFPLKVGNAWIYEYSSNFPPPSGYRYRFISKITKDSIVGNKQLFFIDNISFIAMDLSSNWFWVDSVNGNLFNYNRALGCRKNNLNFIDSLGANLNELCRPCPKSYNRQCYAVTNDKIFNVYTETKNFDFIPVLFHTRRDYSKNFGIIFSFIGELGYYPVSYTLKGCIIDGIVYGDTSLTGIVNVGSEIPIAFSLSQNYPNPFNPTTNIQFQVPQTGFVKLIAFNSIGEEVQMLVNEELSPGTYSADFEGTNLPSGVYYYKLESGTFTQTKKMVLIK